MVRGTAEALTEHVHEMVGDGLRTVVIVQPDGYEIYYLRDDLRDQYSEETFADVVDAFRVERPFMSPDTETRPVGERRAIVHYHEHAFVLQFPFSNDEAIVVSLDAETGRHLMEFIDDLREIVREEQ